MADALSQDTGGKGFAPEEMFTGSIQDLGGVRVIF